MSKIVVFDFDGTIGDSFDTCVELLYGMSREFLSTQLSREELASGLREKTSEEILKDYDIGLWKFMKLLSKLRKGLNERLPECEPYDGMKGVLRSLRERGFRLVILSLSPKKGIQESLSKNGMDGLFDRVYSVFNYKGKRRVLKKLRRRDRDLFYVGDQHNDIKAGKAAGVVTVGVSWGFDTVFNLEIYCPDYLLNQPQELLEVIK